MEEKKSIGFFAYFFAILSFIPIVGIIFIISSFSYGIAKRKIGGYKILIIGVIGLIIQIALANYSFNKLLSDDDSIMVEVTTKSAYENLDKTIKNIELFKKYKNKYPDNLEELIKFNNTLDKKSTHLYEKFVIFNLFKERNIEKLFINYKLINNNEYYLYSKGMDAKKNTKDDLYPKNITIKSGYIDKRKNR